MDPVLRSARTKGLFPSKGEPLGEGGGFSNGFLAPPSELTGKKRGGRFSPCREPTRPRSYLGPRCGPGQVQLPIVQGKDSRRVWERSHCLMNDVPASSGESHGERSRMSHSLRLMEGCARGRPCRRPKDHASTDEAGFTCDPGRPTSL